MKLQKLFPDAVSYCSGVKADIENDRKKHSGAVKQIRTLLYYTHYLWTPLFVGIDILFAWILQVRPKK